VERRFGLPKLMTPRRGQIAEGISRSFISASSRLATWDRMSSANCLACSYAACTKDAAMVSPSLVSRIDLDWSRRAA